MGISMRCRVVLDVQVHNNQYEVLFAALVDKIRNTKRRVLVRGEFNVTDLELVMHQPDSRGAQTDCPEYQ